LKHRLNSSNRFIKASLRQVFVPLLSQHFLIKLYTDDGLTKIKDNGEMGARKITKALQPYQRQKK
jgi:hypothetical protein